MKLMKRIAAIMLSVVMVLGMSSVVSASTATTPAGTATGSITINGAVPGQEYRIYKILELESYSHSGTPANGNYAYKAATKWETFVTTGGGQDYLTTDPTSKYVTWKSGVAATEAKAAEFAKKALDYAKDTTHFIAYDQNETATGDTVTFTGLGLGYYLVDSSVGALCILNTTTPDINIVEKNGVPSVEKKVEKGSAYVDENTASIGDTVKFQTTITAKAGAENYVLHDKMDDGLTFDANSVAVKWTDASGTDKGAITKGEAADPKDYIVVAPGSETAGSACTFEIKFSQTFCDRLVADDKLIVTYSAILNENASIGATGNTNKTKLTYGDNKETTESSTTTYTFEVPVFKYTKDTDGNDKGLAGAIFALSKDNATVTSRTDINLVANTTASTGDGEYRVAKAGETPTTATITTPDTGKFTIKGLCAGTYYLYETKQPDGYNKLKDPVKVVINENGDITVDDDTTTVTEVKVLNKTGSLLPSTGGRGTTILYVLGALLVLGSSVVLITKRRMKE